MLSAPSFRVFMRIAGVVFGLNLAIFSAFAQELYFKTDLNATTYEFRNTLGVKLTDFLPATVSSYEFGFEFPFVKGASLPHKIRFQLLQHRILLAQVTDYLTLLEQHNAVGEIYKFGLVSLFFKS